MTFLPPPPPPRARPRGTIPPFSALLLGAAGGALIGNRRGLTPQARAAATVSGLALIGAAARGPLTDALCRLGTRRRGTSVQLSFIVPRPVEQVFAFCRDFENFPRLIRTLRHVRDHGDGRSHWSASTPTGGTLEWDTVTTKYVPNSVIAWESVGHSPVRMRAILRFVPENGVTCMKVTAEYQVVEGSVRDALVALATRSRRERLASQIRRLADYLERALPEPVDTAAGD
ncbi:MAG: SRPBCC family protein [Gemmatimonadaceae bacterium]